MIDSKPIGQGSNPCTRATFLNFGCIFVKNKNMIDNKNFLTVAMYFKSGESKLTLEIISIDQSFEASVNNLSDIFKNTKDTEKLSTDDKKVAELLNLKPNQKALNVYLGDSDNNIKAVFENTNKVTSKYLDDCGESGAVFELDSYGNWIEKIQKKGSGARGVENLNNIITQYKENFRSDILDNF